jgi:two-component sensor histidine kinase/PAS domain-containing protein
MRDGLKRESDEEFFRFYITSSLPIIRLGLIITLLLFTSYALFNQFLLPGKPEIIFYMRFGLISPVIILSVVVMYIPRLNPHLPNIFIVLNLMVCLLIFFIGATSAPSQPGYPYYPTWVMLVIFGLFTFYRLRFRTLTTIGALMVLAYILANIVNGTYLDSQSFYSNLFFVISVYSIGFFMSYIVESLTRENFMNQKALSENNEKLLQEVQERKEAVEALRTSELQYHQALDSIPDWIYVLDKDLRFVMLNSALQEEHIRQGFPISCIGKKITKIYPYIPETTLEEFHQVFKTGKMIMGEQRFFLRDKTIYGETRKVPIFHDNQVSQIMIIMRNRSEEKEIEELKQKNIEQKEVMLREIHHRVKNNLAIVVSLLNLQLRNNHDPELQRIIRDIEMRIRSMALIHEHLYRSDNLDRIPLHTYIHSLGTIILGTFSGKHVTLTTNLDPVEVSIDTALPIGLITNELLTNAFKYAFPDDREAEIQVSLKKGSGDEITLTISDNGIGLPDDFSMKSQTSLGMFIIKLLVEQLDGTIEYRSDGGATFTIQFTYSHKIPKNIIS